MNWGFVRGTAIGFLFVFASSSFAQNCQAIFLSDGPLWSTCEGSEPLPDYSRAVLFWDVDRDGPDYDYDRPPCGGPDVVCIPEDFMSNYREFYFGGYGFMSPLFEGFYYLDGNLQLFLRVYVSPEEEIQWTSPVFTLELEQQPSIQFVNLPINGWICGRVEVEPPPCQTEPGYVDFDLDDGVPNETCVRTCRGGKSSIWIWGDDLEPDPTRPPVIVVESGCDGMTPAADFSFNPAAFWQSTASGNWFSIDRGIIGHEYGYLTVHLLEQPPVGEVETFEVVREDSTVQLSWTTSWEINLAAFEIWITHAIGGDWPRYVATLPATNSGSGDSYVFVDPEPRPIWQYWYTILMVGEDSVKYAARRVFLPRVAPAEETPDRTTIPDSPRLLQNYPNPFNAATSITFILPSTMDVNLSIHDILGREVERLAAGVHTSGSHTITFDGEPFASGVYVARLTAGSFVSQKKILLLK
ncbi:T9SS type A sorting domain-containing protein [bacterium]|nr:T9SS type A sorting domain-containing protein [bacterium]MBU1636947.1 T9SS type A sorting domain-containing protein [bacterium]MBU1921316.1 T9SS type A sorting domain-containing protein [bacterium]